eukprot:1363591-Pyramimonas_sp.AAC.1
MPAGGTSHVRGERICLQGGPITRGEREYKGRDRGVARRALDGARRRSLGLTGLDEAAGDARVVACARLPCRASRNSTLAE